MGDVGDSSSSFPSSPSAAESTPSKSSNLFLQIVQHLDGTISRPFVPTTTASSSSSSSSSSSIALSKDVPLNPAHNTWLRLYLPHEGDAEEEEEEEEKLLPIILYFHGGGFVLFGADSAFYDASCAAMAASVPALVVSLHYRLAPEHRLPAAYDDALDALLWLRSQSAAAAAAAADPWIARRGDFSRCFVMGSSSGANMAYHAALRFAAAAAADDDDAETLTPTLTLRGLILNQPYFGGAERTASEAASEDDFMLPLRANDMLWRLALPAGADRDHHFCNPLAAPPLPALTKLPSHKAWQAEDVAATYSASEDDKAVVTCFFELHEIAPDPRVNTLPEVLFLSSKESAQSLSESPNKLKLVTYEYQIL